MIKARRIGLGMWGSAYNILIGKPEGRILLRDLGLYERLKCTKKYQEAV
jgi:hypothetical protein